MRKNKPSRTALEVAGLINYFGEDPLVGPLMPPGCAEESGKLLIAAGVATPEQMAKMRSPSMRRRIAFAERLYSGHLMYVGLRKRFLDDETIAGILSGARQVLNVGAGYDTLAMRRAAEYPEVRWIEIDHPATQEAKRRGLENLADFEWPSNLHLLPVDLTEVSLHDALAACEAWDPEAPSVIMAEGVLMYLDEADVRRFFATAGEHSGTGSKLLFTWMRCDEKGKLLLGPLSWLSRLSLRLKGEPLRWGAPGDEALAALLREYDWSLEASGGALLKERYLDPAGIDQSESKIELVAVASS